MESNDMNKRIKELAELAGLYDEKTPEEVPEFTASFEKFAQLIVRECADVIFNGQFSDEECEGNTHRLSYNNGRFGARKDIKEHFGVGKERTNQTL
jgi:hypothetical protein